MRSKLALAIGLVAGLCCYLGYRVVTLQQQLDVLRAQLGAPVHDDKAHASNAQPSAQGHEQRIARLEHDVSSLRDDMRSLELATETTLAEPAPGAAADPKQILSVVGNEVTRIRDRQLEFSRTNWLKWRHGGLQAFATQHKLSDQQNHDMDELMTKEVDRIVELFRRQDLADKPEQFAADAAAILHDTDDAASGVLGPEVFAPWMQTRLNERHTLWPWLPE